MHVFQRLNLLNFSCLVWKSGEKCQDILKTEFIWRVEFDQSCLFFLSLKRYEK